MVNNGDMLSSLTSEGLCEKLKSSGTKILSKVAQIFEEQEIDGEDLTSLTHEELCELLPKLGMRKKLEKFVGKLGFRLVTLPEDEANGGKGSNADLPALEPSTPKTSSSTPSFVLLSDSASPQEAEKSDRKKSRAPKKANKTVLDLTGESENNGKKNSKVITIRLPKGKAMPSMQDLKKLAAKFHVKYGEMRQAVKAAEQLRRSVFVSGLPCCTTRDGLKTLIDDLKKHIERKTKVRSREVDVSVKMFKSNGRVMIKANKAGEITKVVKALDGLFLEPEFRVLARRDSIPTLNPQISNLYNKIKSLVKELYPTLIDSPSARRTQEEITKRATNRKQNEKMNRVWGKGSPRSRAGARPLPIVVTPTRGTYSKVENHHFNSRVSRVSDGPSRIGRDRLTPRPVVRSQIIQNVRLGSTTLPCRAQPVDRRTVPVDRRAPLVGRRAQPIDRRAQPTDRRDQLIDRRAPLIDRRAPPVDRRPAPDRRPGPPGSQINQWRSSTIIPNNQSGARETGLWNEISQGTVRRSYDQGVKSSISNRRSHEATAVQGRRLPVSQRPINYNRKPHEVQPSRNLAPPQSFHDRAVPQRTAVQARQLPRRGAEIPFKYSENTPSQQYMDRNSRMPAPRLLGRQQVSRRLSPQQSQRMDQRDPRSYIERVSFIPTARGQMSYEQKRISSAIPGRRQTYVESQQGYVMRGNNLRGPIHNRQQDQSERIRGRKRRLEEASVPGYRESLFITRRNDRGGVRARY